MRVMMLGVVGLFALASSLEAQGVVLVDHWSTVDECLAASTAPYYYPTIRSSRNLAMNEVVRGHPTGGCVDMDLPDRSSGRGWVRVDADRQFVYNRLTGQILRLAECNNNVYSIVPFEPLRGSRGERGEKGETGGRGEKGDKGDQGEPGRFRWPFSKKETLIGAGVVTVAGVACIIWCFPDVSQETNVNIKQGGVVLFSIPIP